MYTHLLTGVPYSFTVHGYDEFDNPKALGLSYKVEHASFVATVSSYSRSQLMRWARIEDWSKIAVIHCGLGEESYATVDSVPKPNRFVSVGRLCKEKAQLVLLEALSQLVQEDIDAEVVFVGDGEMRMPLEQRVDELKLRDHVRITGWLDGNGVRDELVSARALVHPSFADGLPIVIMEAMALRRPVITCYIAGTPELVREGETGWLVPASSVDDLAGAMKRCLATSVPDLAQMGENARVRVRERHRVDAQAAKLGQLFTK